jgi:hypothetical protein
MVSGIEPNIVYIDEMDEISKRMADGHFFHNIFYQMMGGARRVGMSWDINQYVLNRILNKPHPCGNSQCYPGLWLKKQIENKKPGLDFFYNERAFTITIGIKALKKNHHRKSRKIRSSYEWVNQKFPIL